MDDKVEIIIADIRQFQGKEEQILWQIAPCYAAKYRRTKLRQDAEQELAAGYLLKRYLGIIRDEQLTYNACNKPLLASGKTFFNLSHSENMVALAIGSSDVGVDIEKIMTCHEATVKKVFNEKQKEELLQLKGNAKNEKFTEIWTQCEAKLKLKGTGFEDSWEQIKKPVKCSLFTAKTGDYVISCATKKKLKSSWKSVIFSFLNTFRNTVLVYQFPE